MINFKERMLQLKSDNFLCNPKQSCFFIFNKLKLENLFSCPGFQNGIRKTQYICRAIDISWTVISTPNYS